MIHEPNIITDHKPGCTGKKPFGTMQAARRRAKIMRRKYDKPLEAYHCRHCRAFHIGEPWE